jgi:predicted nuclease with TOPRIM domain
MSDKTMKETLDDWEKQADKLVKETKKVGSATSKEIDKQLQVLQDEGAKLFDSIKRGDVEGPQRIELEKRYNEVKDKLKRAWEELNK